MFKGVSGRTCGGGKVNRALPTATPHTAYFNSTIKMVCTASLLLLIYLLATSQSDTAGSSTSISSNPESSGASTPLTNKEASNTVTLQGKRLSSYPIDTGTTDYSSFKCSDETTEFTLCIQKSTGQVRFIGDARNIPFCTKFMSNPSSLITPSNAKNPLVITIPPDGGTIEYGTFDADGRLIIAQLDNARIAEDQSFTGKYHFRQGRGSYYGTLDMSSHDPTTPSTFKIAGSKIQGTLRIRIDGVYVNIPIEVSGAVYVPIEINNAFLFTIQDGQAAGGTIRVTHPTWGNIRIRYKDAQVQSVTTQGYDYDGGYFNGTLSFKDNSYQPVEGTVTNATLLRDFTGRFTGKLSSKSNPFFTGTMTINGSTFKAVTVTNVDNRPVITYNGMKIMS